VSGDEDWDIKAIDFPGCGKYVAAYRSRFSRLVERKECFHEADGLTDNFLQLGNETVTKSL
jgi:hypothetical protein